MILGAPLGLLALAALPAIVAVHVFRRRFRPRPVSALFLYGAQVRTVAAGRTRQRVLNRASLWLELLAAAALAWWLCDLHLTDREVATQIAVILDSRLRVSARAPGAGSAAERIRAALDARFATLTRDDRVTLIASGAPPRLLAGPGALPDDARRALAAWTPGAAWHELDDSLVLARSLAGDGEVLLASDRLPPGLPPRIAMLACGRALATSGLVDARWLRDRDGERLVARVLAQGGAGHRTLELRTVDGAVLARQELALADRVPASASFALATASAPGTAVPAALVLALGGDDPLPGDDTATLLRPPHPPLRVQLALAGPARAMAERALAAVGDVVIGGGSPQLLIGGDDAPPAGAWQLRFAAGGAAPALGPFLARRGHALLREVDFTGVLWAGGLPDDALPAQTTALLEAGRAVLISERRRGRDRLVTLHLDAARATLGEHPAWPSMIANLLAARRDALPGPRQPNLLAGHPTTVVLPEGVPGVTLVADDGARARFLADGDGEVLIPGLERGGRQQLVLDGADQPWAELAVLPLDARQGDLAEAASGTRAGAGTVSGAAERRRSPLAHLLPIVLAAGAALAAWACFRREEGRAP